MYTVGMYLQLLKEGDKIYISHPQSEYDKNLIIYVHPSGNFSIDKCKEEFEDRMQILINKLEGRAKNILVIEHTLTRVNTYILDRSVLSWQEFCSSAIMQLHQRGIRKPSITGLHTEIQITDWKCVRALNHRVLDF